MINLMHGDCLDFLPHIADQSIDLILCDLPYGTTRCKWDVVIDFDKLWSQYNRIIKTNGVVCLFSKQPFTTRLINSNLKNYKYSLVWVKDNHDNPMMAKKRFLNITEDICIFYQGQCTYNPQGLKPLNKITKQGRGSIIVGHEKRPNSYYQAFTNYPKNLLFFKRDPERLHRTQKPVALLEYLIKTFTHENQTVLDNCVGSGSTAIACLNSNRKGIFIEKDKQIYLIAKNRIDLHQLNLNLIIK